MEDTPTNHDLLQGSEINFSINGQYFPPGIDFQGHILPLLRQFVITLCKFVGIYCMSNT